MKKAILGLVIVLGLLAVVAIQQDWLNINPKTDTAGKTTGFSVDVDKDKAKQDVKAGLEKTKEAAGEAAEKAKELGKEALDKTKEAGKAVVDKTKEVLGGTKPAATPPSK